MVDKQVTKGRRDVFNFEQGTNGTFVCSSHCGHGTRTGGLPETDYHSLFLTTNRFLMDFLPKKWKTIEQNYVPSMLTIKESESLPMA